MSSAKGSDEDGEENENGHGGGQQRSSKSKSKREAAGSDGEPQPPAAPAPEPPKKRSKPTSVDTSAATAASAVDWLGATGIPVRRAHKKQRIAQATASSRRNYTPQAMTYSPPATPVPSISRHAQLSGAVGITNTGSDMLNVLVEELKDMAAERARSETTHQERIQQIKCHAARQEGRLSAFPEYIGVLREQAATIIGTLRPRKEIHQQQGVMLTALDVLSDKLAAATTIFQHNAAQSAECSAARVDIEQYRETLYDTSVWVDGNTRLGDLSLDILTTIVSAIHDVASLQPAAMPLQVLPGTPWHPHPMQQQTPFPTRHQTPHPVQYQSPGQGLQYPQYSTYTPGPLGGTQDQPIQSTANSHPVATEKSLDKMFGDIPKLERADDHSLLKWVIQMHAAIKWIEAVEKDGDKFSPHSVLMGMVSRAGCKASTVNTLSDRWLIIQKIFDSQSPGARRGSALRSIDRIDVQLPKTLADAAGEIHTWLTQLTLAQTILVKDWVKVEPDPEKIRRVLISRLDDRDGRKTSLIALDHLDFATACAQIDDIPAHTEEKETHGQFLWQQEQSSSSSSSVYPDPKNEQWPLRRPQYGTKGGKGKGGGRRNKCYKKNCDVLPQPHLWGDCRDEVERLDNRTDEEVRQSVGVNRAAPLAKEPEKEKEDSQKVRKIKARDEEDLPKCYNCNKPGHMQKNCTRRRQ